MAFVIKAAIGDPGAATFAFAAQKTMYGGRHIAEGDTVFLFSSENEGGVGLIARGVVTASQATAKVAGVVRQTPRVSVVVTRVASTRQPSGRETLKRFTAWHDGRPETELNFKLYRQATNKIAGISDATAAYLDGFF